MFTFSNNMNRYWTYKLHIYKHICDVRYLNIKLQGVSSPTKQKHFKYLFDVLLPGYKLNV